MANTATQNEVIVIGGGLAGISAACAVADNGFSVTLLERNSWLGGRAGGPSCGAHVTLGCCTSYLGLLEKLGTRQLIHRQNGLRLTVVNKGVSGRLQAGPLPAPFHLSGSFFRFPFLTARDKLAIGRGLLATAMHSTPAPEETFHSWLTKHKQTPAARRFFWELLATPALNAPANEAAAELALKVFRDAVLGGRSASAISFLPADLTTLLEPVASYLSERHGELQLKSPVAAITPQAKGFFVRLSDGRTLAGKTVIAAVPPGALSRLLPPAVRQKAAFKNAARIVTNPILDVEVLYAKHVIDEAVLVVPGLPALWLFAETPAPGVQRVRASLSCPGSLAQAPNSTVAAWMQKYLCQALPRTCDVPIEHIKVARQARATFSAAPLFQQWRLGNETPLPGLFVAGDWTDTGWPSTMEGAVRSGLAAAQGVLPGNG